jgi:hypothetical protein
VACFGTGSRRQAGLNKITEMKLFRVSSFRFLADSFAMPARKPLKSNDKREKSLPHQLLASEIYGFLRIQC